MTDDQRKLELLIQNISQAKNPASIVIEVIDLLKAMAAEVNQDGGTIAVAIVDLAPYLTPVQIESVLEVALNIDDPICHVLALLGLLNRANNLTAIMRERALKSALKSAFTIEHGLTRIRCLTSLLNVLSVLKDDNYEETTQQVLSIALTIENLSDRVQALAVLSPHLPEAQRNRILQLAIDTAELIPGEDEKLTAIESVQPYL
ncbi:MAG: hypothetical protein IT324_24540 [Anaerolineae bacterium]|nr:hypothetical protein [Anaerolineae bacterium]